MPPITAEHLAAFVDWLYGYLLNVLGVAAIFFLIALLIGQELARAYRGSAQSDSAPVIPIASVGLLLIAFLILALFHILRILHLL